MQGKAVRRPTIGDVTRSEGGTMVGPRGQMPERDTWCA